MNPFLLNPWFLLGAGVAALALAGGGYWKGSADTFNRDQVKIDRMVDAAKEQVEEAKQQMLIEASNASLKLETGNAQSRTVFRTIMEGVDHLVVQSPLYRDSCFDDGGLQLANAALAGVSAAPAAAGGSDPAMPDAQPAH